MSLEEIISVILMDFNIQKMRVFIYETINRKFKKYQCYFDGF